MRLSTLLILLACAVFAAPIMKMDFETMPSELKGTAKLATGNGGKGKGLMLDGNGRLEIQPSQELLAAEENGTLTFECWILREDEDEEGFLVRHNGAFAVRILPWDKRRVGLGVWTKEAGYLALDSEPCLPAAGAWQHIAVVFKPTEAELYINGNQKFKKPLKSPMRVSRHPVVIGAGLDEAKKTPIAPFVGTMDDLLISSDAKDKAYFDAIAAETSEQFEAVQNTIGMPPKCASGNAITEKTSPKIVKKEKTLEISNSFYVLEMQTVSQLKIMRFFNKFTNSECLLPEGSPLFAIALEGGTRRAPTESFAVADVKTTTDAKGVIHLEAVSRHASGVEVRIRMDFDETEEISVNASVKNGGKRQKIVPCVPLLENISIGSDFNENWYFNPQVSGWTGKASYELGFGYGFRSWIQLADVFSPALGGGLALTGQDTKGVVKGIVTRKTKRNGKVSVNYNLCWLTAGDKEPIRAFDDKGLGLAFAFVYYPDVYAPNEEVALPPAKFSVHSGDVLNPLMHYAEWSKKAFPHEPIPKNAIDEFNMVAVHPRGGNGGYFKGFETPEGFKLADKIADDGSDHLLQPAFWWRRYERVPVPKSTTGETMFKNSSGEGDYDYEPAFGGKEGMAKEIRACKEKGTNVVLYTCSRVVGDDSTIATKHPDWALFKAPNTPNRSWGNFNVCTSIPEWQEMYAENNARLLRDLPVAGIYMDTTAEILTCHNTAHSHPRHPQDAIFALLKKVRGKVKAVNPDAYIMTEYIGSEAFGMYIDSCWVQTFANPHAHKFNNYDLDFARFVYPRIKYHEWGMSPKTFEVDSRRAFFNGVGNCRGDLTGEQKIRFADMTNAQREMFNALISDNPLPFVQTCTENVFANCFPGSRQKVWTYYNKAGKLENAPVLNVLNENAGVHYVELLKDIEIQPKGGILFLSMEQHEVGMIAALPKMLQVVKNGGKLDVSAKGDIPAGATIVCVPAGKRDSQDNFLRFDVSGGAVSIPTDKLGKGKNIVKLYDGRMLLDEIIISF